MSESFDEAMLEQLQVINAEAMRMVKALRTENRTLKQQISKFAPEMYAMREQITMLEMQIQDARRAP